jgi:hypothetical protein
MAKAEKLKKTAKPSKKDQYERFVKTVRDLGIDEQKSREAFERAFSRIVPPKRKRYLEGQPSETLAQKKTDHR